MLLTYYTVGQPVAAYLFWRFGAEVVGIENIPRSEPVLLVGNHQSQFDGVLILRAVRRRVRTMIKSDNEDPRVLFLLKVCADMYTIRRNSPDHAALGKTIKLLERGHAVCMFPEGHRSREVIGFHPGVSIIARKINGLTIVPFGICNAEHLDVKQVLRNIHRGIAASTKPTITVGRPFKLPPAGLPPKLQRLEDANLLRQRVLDLLPRELEGENELYKFE